MKGTMRLAACLLLCAIIDCSAWDLRKIFDSKHNNIEGFLHIPHIPKCDPLLVSMLRDATLVNRDLFTWKSFAVLSATFPFYIGARMFDEPFHDVFYDSCHHWNLNQLPKWVVDYSDVLIFGPFTVLGSLTFFARDPELRLTGRVFLETMPFIYLARNVIKSFETRLHVRPKNEHFNRYKCAYGGFPSGHMATSVYMAMLYGMRFGHRWGIPLTFLSFTTGAILVSSNRHFLSQVVAGAAMGAIFAFASNSVVEYNLNRDIECGITLDQAGNPAVTLGCAF